MLHVGAEHYLFFSSIKKWLTLLFLLTILSKLMILVIHWWSFLSYMLRAKMMSPEKSILLSFTIDIQYMSFGPSLWCSQECRSCSLYPSSREIYSFKPICFGQFLSYLGWSCYRCMKNETNNVNWWPQSGSFKPLV